MPDIDPITAAMNRGAIAALRLLRRGYETTEGETEMDVMAEDIANAIRSRGLADTIRLQIEYERSLSIPGEFSVRDAYGPFPTSLRNLAAKEAVDA